MRGTAIVLAVSIASACASSGGETIVLHPTGLLRITGTFSGIRVEENRGVFGAEVRIVSSDEPPYQAALQFGTANFCESRDLGSEPCFRVSNLIVVAAEYDWKQDAAGAAHVRFRIPAESGYGSVFEGNVTEHALRGTFVFDSGKVLSVDLPRGLSHWDGPGK
jgi:hypothetical protein